MDQNAIIEHSITVNPIYDNTVYINDALATNVDFVDAVLLDDIPDSGSNCTTLKNIISCVFTIICLAFMLFSLFLFTGGIGVFLTIYGGDDST